MATFIPKGTVRLQPLSDSVLFTGLPDDFDVDPTDEDLRLASEVRALPDIVPDERKLLATRRLSTPIEPAKGGVAPSGPADLSVSTRLERRRRERHDATLQELNLSLEQIQEQMADQVRSVAEHCRAKIAELTEAVNTLLKPVCDEALLTSHTADMLDDVEVKLGGLFDTRKAVISSMMASLSQVEAERRKCISTTMLEHGKALVSIAFQLRPDVERTLFRKSHQLNMWILENKAATAVLQARLLSFEVNFFESVRHKLEVQRAHWHQLRQDIAITTLTDQLETIPSVDAVVASARQRGDADSAPIRRELLEVLVASAHDLMPIDLDDMGLITRVENWRSRALTLVVAWDEVHSRVLTSLELDMDDTVAELDRLSSRCQVDLVREGACDSSLVSALVDPIVSAKRDAREGAANTILEAITTSSASGSAAIADGIREYFEETVAVATLWDTLCDACTKELNAYRKASDAAHAKAEADREKDEEDMAGYVDGLRHAQSGDDLESTFETVKRRLDAMKESHSTYDRSAKALTQAYRAKTSVAVSTWGDAMQAHMKTWSRGEAAAPSDPVDDTSAENSPPLAGSYSVIGERLGQSRDEYRELWLSSLDARVNTLTADIDHFVAGEYASIDAVVEMHLSVHQERVQRIEEAVVNIRKAELLLHRNRVARHCRGLDKELEKESERFKALQKDVKERSLQFTKALEEQIAKLSTFQNVTLLQGLRDRAAETADAFRVEVRKLLQRYRQSVDDALGSIRETNAVLRNSFKTFSEGGNFSSFEIVTYTEVLVALESRIDEAETMIIDVLNTMEGEQVIVAENMIQTCEDRLKVMLRDVKLYETSRVRLRSMQVEFKSLIGECNAQSAALDAEMALIRDLEPDTPVDHIFALMRKLAGLVQGRAKLLGALKPTAEEAAEAAAAADEEESEAVSTKSEKPQGKSKKGAKRKTVYVPKTAPVLTPWTVSNTGTFMVSANDLRVRYRKTIVDELVVPYYESLHGKTPMRGDLVPDSAQQFIDSIEADVTKMFERVLQYHGQCLTEFVDQVVGALKVLKRLMPRPFESATGNSLSEIEANEAALDAAFNVVFTTWQSGNTSLLQELRPALGHPQNAAALEELIQKEADAFEGILKSVDDRQASARAKVEQMGPSVLKEMHNHRQALFDICRGLVHDTDIGIRVSAKKSLKAMLKDHVLGDSEDAARAAAGGIREVPVDVPWPSVQVGPSLDAAKAPDSATNRTIHTVYKKHASTFAAAIEVCMGRVTDKTTKVRDMIEHTHRNWLAAVEKVRDPYAAAL
mmetsp:Transcript_29594/g.77623  ORF Transcript_29594/g.77623 Transcript_29594/m.77623 type:complete len:1285 (+) Transcript_29594:256-4110(+)|eukprot:CAMPEP_0182952316 /NCGR_PEP_ID=MMETSP0105_2-20130417/61707_1 /TAXON_ID=81532 ORGANISM="Acanthoeca-like sp., Strain 10tr" /NCGR_SAMPLE_ID=MMETSP0105_2 /ASSEMBLY_ACC=CAM_ASM_000205 /LENGTH=1284 /DNA_ID=CAMNT_0025092637 /DNA_START=148 /DNA_END=4002 /DNA_ORIENTATION=+